MKIKSKMKVTTIFVNICLFSVLVSVLYAWFVKNMYIAYVTAFIYVGIFLMGFKDTVTADTLKPKTKVLTILRYTGALVVGWTFTYLEFMYMTKNYAWLGSKLILIIGVTLTIAFVLLMARITDTLVNISYILSK